MTVERRFLIVANPVARRGAEAIIDELRGNAPAGAILDVEYTRTGHFATGELNSRAAGCEAVIAVGGDGTVADAATATAGSHVALGIIGAGSTNILARNLRIPHDLGSAARLIFSRPRTRTLDVGICNDRRFLHMGGAGLDSRMFAMTSKRLKRYLGWVAYIQGASQTILAPPARFRITVDGEVLECDSPLVLVANGGSIIRPGIDVHPGILYDDGLLDVVVFTATTPIEIASTLGHFATRSLERSRLTVHLRGREILIESRPPIPLQLDGDVVGETPGRFSLLPAALEVIVPE
jgi:YegS/Rv2252/BmrU family lipid kinase